MSAPDTHTLDNPIIFPHQPHDGEGPVFHEPWEAQAFAMAVTLEKSGVFTWEQWTRTIGALIAADDRTDKTGERYYHYWLSALEELVAAKTPISSDLLDSRKNAWDRAARATPHGETIELGRDNKFNTRPKTTTGK